MTDLALDLQNAAAAMNAHDAMIAVIADVRAVLPRFIVLPTTRVLHGADEDGGPFLTIALPDRRLNLSAMNGRDSSARITPDTHAAGRARVHTRVPQG